MRTTWLVICFLICCVDSRGAEPPAAAHPPPSPSATPTLSMAGQTPERYQESYDLEATGKIELALDALNRLPASDRDSYVAQLRRGWLLHRLGRFDEASAAYARAIAIAPSAVEPKVGALAPLIALRRWKDVEATSRDVLRIDPANYSATLRLAYAMYNTARFADAQAGYAALLTLYPSDTDARSGLGWSLLKAGKKSEAAKVFADLLAIAPRNALAIEGARACN
jgi:tetratricopeptide (TPR) repeat protein